MPEAEYNFQTSGSAVEARPHSEYERRIARLEKELGIKTEYDRLLEASLFIDRKFLNFALITGFAHPERLFGDGAWADYLESRAYAKKHRGEPLTLELIKELQSRTSRTMGLGISGVIRSTGVTGGSFDKESEPITLTSEQLEAVKENPQLSFRLVPPGNTERKGFIYYPHGTASADMSIQEAVVKDIEGLCTWFNTERNKKGVDLYVLAAQLQQRFIALHPFRDANGRVSRVLMNWVLESAKPPLSPSILFEPNDDIFSTEADWIEKVRAGSEFYGQVVNKKQLLENQNIHAPEALFNLSEDRAFYEYVYKYLYVTPKFFQNGEKHNHALFEKYLDYFKEEMTLFQKYIRSTATFKKGGESYKISQSGLVSSEFMQVICRNGLHILPKEMQEMFFTNVEAYRGGIVEGPVSDTTILQLFSEYTGFGSSYKAINSAYVNSLSAQRIEPKKIQETMKYYNRLLAGQYFESKHREIKNPHKQIIDQEARGKQLERIMSDHVLGSNEKIQESPFVSTSLSYSVSKQFAQHYYISHAQERHGVVIRSLVPKEGVMFSFGKHDKSGVSVSGIFYESEVLTVGGISPDAITAIEIYDKEVRDIPTFFARKIEQDGKVMVVIEDRRNEKIERRTYTYINGAFVQTKKEQTNIPSSAQVDLPSQAELPGGYDYDPKSKLQLYHKLHSDTHPIYISPFHKESQWEPLIKIKSHEYYFGEKFKGDK